MMRTHRLKTRALRALLAACVISGTCGASWEFPATALSNASSNTLIASVQIGNGVYNTTQSAGSNSAVFAFDKSDVTTYRAGPGYDSSTGEYTVAGNRSLTISGISRSGEWLAIFMPVAVRLTSYILVASASQNFRNAPRTWYLAGSNNSGVTWTTISAQTVSQTVSSAGGFRPYTVSPTESYTSFALLVTSVQLSGNDGFVDIGDLELFGVAENLKFPPVGISEGLPEVSGATHGNGIYTVSASSALSSYGPYSLFDDSEDWVSASERYDIASGAYIGGATTLVSATQRRGEWIKIAFPVPVRLTSYAIIASSASYKFVKNSPRLWVLGGSNDGGTTWTETHSVSSVSQIFSGDERRVYAPPTTNAAFSTYIFIGIAIQEYSIDGALGFTQLQFYGEDATIATPALAGAGVIPVSACAPVNTPGYAWSCSSNCAIATQDGNGATSCSLPEFSVENNNPTIFSQRPPVDTTDSRTGDNVRGYPIDYEFPYQFQVTSYTVSAHDLKLRLGTDSATYSPEGPTSFTILGSNNKNTWFSLDSRWGIAYVSSPTQTFYIPVSRIGVFRYVRFVVTSVSKLWTSPSMTYDGYEWVRT